MYFVSEAVWSTNIMNTGIYLCFLVTTTPVTKAWETLECNINTNAITASTQFQLEIAVDIKILVQQYQKLLLTVGTEGWHENPQARLFPLCLRKRTEEQNALSFGMESDTVFWILLWWRLRQTAGGSRSRTVELTLKQNPQWGNWQASVGLFGSQKQIILF